MSVAITHLSKPCSGHAYVCHRMMTRITGASLPLRDDVSSKTQVRSASVLHPHAEGKPFKLPDERSTMGSRFIPVCIISVMFIQPAEGFFKR